MDGVFCLSCAFFVVKMKEFLDRYENEKVVESLFNIVILCGKQGLPLCGHHDDHVFSMEQEEREAENRGNFIELVRFKSQTDDALRQHLEKPPRNALYTSKTIQNDIIGKQIHSGILDKVK